MADSSISDLPEVVSSNTTDADVMVIVNAGANKKIKIIEVLQRALVSVVDKILFNTTITNPTHQEGLLFYDKDRKTHSGYTDIPDFTQNFGQEVTARAFNNTGATIDNGSPIILNGIVNAGFFEIELAIATTFTNADVRAIATHDIPHGTIGAVTRIGAVGDVNLSAFIEGEALYLSDTVAGGLVSSSTVAQLPDVLTKVGFVANNSASGTIGTDIIANVVLPTLIGIMQRLTTTNYSTTATFQNITNYDSGDGILVPFNLLTGVMTISTSGFYNFSINYYGNFSVRKTTVEFQIWDNTNGVELWMTPIKIEDTQDTPIAYDISTSISLGITLIAEAPIDIVIRVRSLVSGTLTVTKQSFNIKSEHIR